MRKFGVEIEVGLLPGVSRTQVAHALRAAGLGGQEFGYNGHDAHNWVVKADGSVPGGAEVVSPPLDFDDEAQRDQVTRALTAMTGLCRPVAAGGIHVHVESRDLTPKQLSGVVSVFTHFEDIIYRLASSGWETIRPGVRTYAYPFSETEKKNLLKARDDTGLKKAYYGDNDWAYATSHGHHSRYHGLNLHSHWFRGTIEFRVFNSSMNAQRVQSYISMCMAIVADAAAGHRHGTARALPLGAMAGGADAAKAFVYFLKVMRDWGGMSAADSKLVRKFWKDSKAQQSFSRF